MSIDLEPRIRFQTKNDRTTRRQPRLVKLTAQHGKLNQLLTRDKKTLCVLDSPNCLSPAPNPLLLLSPSLSIFLFIFFALPLAPPRVSHKIWRRNKMVRTQENDSRGVGDVKLSQITVIDGQQGEGGTMYEHPGIASKMLAAKYTASSIK